MDVRDIRGSGLGRVLVLGQMGYCKFWMFLL